MQPSADSDNIARRRAGRHLGSGRGNIALNPIDTIEKLRPPCLYSRSAEDEKRAARGRHVPGADAHGPATGWIRC
jgi:hypothetical protein